VSSAPHPVPASNAEPPKDAEPPNDAGPPDDAGPPKDAEPPDDAGPPEDAGPPNDGGPPKRSRGTARDITLSLIVLLVPLLVIVALFRLTGGEDPAVVDPSSAISQAQAANAFPVAAPRGLSAQWRPVSAAFRTGDGGAVLRIGYLTPDGGAVQLVESNEPVESLLRRELGDQIRPEGMVDVSGEPWQAYQARSDEHALVSTDERLTIIVIGRAGPAELAALAQAVS
jgi:hypothetical protein